MDDFKGKTAFVTGAASGIGLSIAKSLVAEGARVMLCDIEESAFNTAAVQLRELGGEVDTVRADVSVKGDLEAAARACAERFGKIHILVNNAGVVGDSDYGTWTDAGWDWVLGVNLMAVIWGIEIFGPMIESHGEGGHIVCTASVGGLYPGRHSAYMSYNVSKYGVVALCEGLRSNLAARGVGISALCPGMVRTGIGNSSRNLPTRYAGDVPVWDAVSDGQEMPGGIGEAIATGVEPDYVGDLTIEGIRKNWPYIFTDLQYEGVIEARFQAVREGFDKIRDRVPPRVEDSGRVVA